MLVSPQKPANQLLVETAQDPEVPKIYFNGFVNALGTGDITTIVMRNAQPVAMLNMSFTVAKTLSLMLGQIVSNLEEEMATTIMTTEDIKIKQFGDSGDDDDTNG